MLTEISPLHLSVLQFCIGIIILMYSGDRFVALACQLARALATPTLFIGTLVVAFATSIPEILVTLIATQQGNSDIAVGNALGSYISNIALVSISISGAHRHIIGISSVLMSQGTWVRKTCC